MDLEKLFNAKAYPVSKAPTLLSRFFNYFNKEEKQFWVKPGNDLDAAIRTIAIHTGKNEQQVLRDAIDIGITAMEEILTEQATYYRREPDGELVRLDLE